MTQGRPRPNVTPDNEFFWTGAAAGKLLFQRCRGCGELRYPPGPTCPSCLSFDWEAEASKGRGSVYSFTVMERPALSGIELPLTIVLVALDEGVRMISCMAEEPEHLKIGDRVALECVRVEEDLVLPLFRLDGSQRSESSPSEAKG